MTSQLSPAPPGQGRVDASHREITALAPTASGVVIGAPGTGKTEALIARVAALVDSGIDPDQILVLTPTRQTATVLRDRLAVVVDTATRGAMARSIAAFSFQVVRAAAGATGEPSPHLLTAGDQDAIIGDLLAGDAEDEAAGQGRWPASLPASVRGSRAFRGELRALFAECAELGVSAAELAEMGRARSRPEWVAAASFLREYRVILGELRSAHRDSAELLREAAVLVTAADPALAEPVAAVVPDAVVLIDDAQELTPAGVDLVAGLRRRGVAVMAFGDPDISAGAYRGATPHLFARLCTLLADRVHVLDTQHRGVPAITRLTRVVTEAIGAAGRVDHRRPPGPVVPGDVRTLKAPSPLEEVDRIARALREWHVLDRVAWSRLAVIAHDTRQVAELEVELAAREVPTRAAGVQRPLGREQVVRDLVQIVRLGLTAPDEREPEHVTQALTSAFGGLDPVGMRRLRARLRHVELGEGGTRPAAALLVEAFATPFELAMIGTPEAAAAERLATTLQRIADGARDGATVHELLWLVWDRSRDGRGRRLADSWRALAAGDGPAAAEASRSLDALVALFASAKREVERAAEDGASADVTSRFLRRVLDADVPDDTLSAPENPDTVTILTPAAALGTEFECVVIAGVQDGIWPNLRLRGGLLQTWRLPDELDAWRAGAEPPAELRPTDRRRDALHDELRLFARSVSRARSALLVTAVDDDDLGPSPLFSLLPEPDDDTPAAEHPLTLRGLVARHRRTLTTAGAPETRAHAAGQLAVLAREGVPGADPRRWYGALPPSTHAPLRDPERAPVPVSPSKLTTFTECPLDWAIRALGGDTRSRSAGVGTILHAAMEEVPSGDRDALQAVVDARWGELEFEAAWIDRKERAWASLLVDRLHEYLARVGREGGRTIGAETPFRIAITLDADGASAGDASPAVTVIREGESAPEGPTALVSGVIDRIEAYPDGGGEQIPPGAAPGGQRVVVVDLKTGRSEVRVSDAKVVDDPQLSAYQLALLEGGVEGISPQDVAGARLVVLSKTIKAQPHYRLARQETMTPEDRRAFLARIVEAAHGMSSESFDAHLDTHCLTARFAVCPVHTVKAVSAP